MKYLFLSVPQWYPASPYLAPALLAGQLKGKGYSASSYDFNIEFFNDCLTKNYVSKSLQRAKDILNEKQPATSYNDERVAAKMAATYEKRAAIIKDYFEKNSEPEKICLEIEKAVNVLKTRELFYNPEKLFEAKDIISEALKIISLPYAPSKIMLDNYIANPEFTYDFCDVDFQCSRKEVNLFLPYFEKKLDKTDFSEYGFIGLSITDLSQIVPGLTLARLLKKKYKAKICLGGNYIFKISESIKKIPKIFEEYCDFLTIGDGETAIVELAEYMEQKRKIEEVHSLIYRAEKGRITENEKAPLLKLDEVYYPDFEGYDFEKYFSPENVIPVQLGKGCYWGKCTFCDFYTGQQKFDIKSVKRAVDEVEYLSEKYGSQFFNFVDEAVPPKFYYEFAKEIISRNLNIHYYSFARLEKAFSKEVLETLKKSGAKFFMWGYEAQSERVMELMNKGIDVGERKRILKDSADAGLWNLCTFLLCYPTETTEELQSTIEMIYNHDLVDTCTPSNFALKKNAILKNEPSAVSITEVKENGQFHISYKYKSKIMQMDEVKKRRNDFEIKYLRDTADMLWAHTFTDSDYILMYLAKYGRQYMKNYRLKYKRKL